MTPFETTAVSGSGVATEGSAADAVTLRAKIFEMTQAAEDAVLRPAEAGSWPHEFRAAVAARIARLNGERALAKRFLADAGEFAPLANPTNKGADEGLTHVIAFLDKVATKTRDVGASDVQGLQAAGVEDADIVRLAELNAFLSYQVRVVSGLRLLQADEP